jgi:hypothetical protein
MNQSEKLAVVLRYQGALAAEQELTEIANKEGDEAVMKIAANLSAAEVAQVTSEADIVKPSLLHTAINPEQFRGVFRRVGVRWSAAEQDDCTDYTLAEFQEELKQFFCAFILLSDDEDRRIELLKAILEEPHGIEALAFSVVQEKDFPEFMASASQAAEFGDWREVIGILRTRFPEQWGRFVRIAPSYRGKQYNEFVHETAAEIYAVAVAEGAVERKEHEKSDDLFTPLS